MLEQLRVAAVGLTFGDSFLPAFTAHPDVAEVGLCDIAPRTLCEAGERYGIPEARRHPSLDHVLASGLHRARPARARGVDGETAGWRPAAGG